MRGERLHRARRASQVILQTEEGGAEVSACSAQITGNDAVPVTFAEEEEKTMNLTWLHKNQTAETPGNEVSLMAGNAPAARR